MALFNVLFETFLGMRYAITGLDADDANHMMRMVEETYCCLPPERTVVHTAVGVVMRDNPGAELLELLELASRTRSPAHAK